MKVLVIFAALVSLALAEVYFISDEYIEELNSKGLTWKAKRNFPKDTPKEKLYKLASLRGIRDPKSNFSVPFLKHRPTVASPETFDARQNWQFCGSLNEIRSQGACGGSWAFAAVEAISDRICIASGGGQQPRLSSEDLVACDQNAASGCGGGLVLKAWQYWVTNGIVTEECKPYTAGENGQTPDCTQQCSNGADYNADKHYGQDAYQLNNDEESYKTEIIAKGPIETQFDVYADFFNYASGVYQRTSDDYMGAHAVKIVGWGSENGIPFWIVANSWGNGWGEGGFFRIRRGTNECGFETFVYAGTPRL